MNIIITFKYFTISFSHYLHYNAKDNYGYQKYICHKFLYFYFHIKFTKL